MSLIKDHRLGYEHVIHCGDAVDLIARVWPSSTVHHLSRRGLELVVASQRVL